MMVEQNAQTPNIAISIRQASQMKPIADLQPTDIE